MEKVLMLSLLLSAAAAAQPSLSVRLGGTLPFTAEESTGIIFMHDYCPVGFAGALVLQQRLTGFLDAEASIEHDVFLYHRYAQKIYTDDPWALSSSGQPAQLTRFGVDLKVSSPSDTNTSKPFLLLGGCYTLERYGPVHVTWMDSGTSSVTDMEYPSQDSWAVVIGLGAQFRVSRILSLLPTVTYRWKLNDWSFVEGLSYGSVTLQLVYKVIG